MLLEIGKILFELVLLVSWCVMLKVDECDIVCV